jgi:hypothetical protein
MLRQIKCSFHVQEKCGVNGGTGILISRNKVNKMNTFSAKSIQRWLKKSMRKALQPNQSQKRPVQWLKRCPESLEKHRH